jgi:hypothetical protein
MKKKQWCYNCEAEAIYWCCWNTAYCRYTLYHALGFLLSLSPVVAHHDLFAGKMVAMT